MKKITSILAVLIVLLLGIFGVHQFLVVEKAHMSFEAYYAFRGCTKLVSITDSYGVCQLSSGQRITMVKFQGKWYLKGDLPVCYFSFCL